jgi:tetratricopeptide (TPR) repeat protein
MERYDAAVKWYEEAVRLGVEDPNVLTDLGTCYLATNRADKAIELYQRSLVIDPKHAQTLQNLGYAYFTLTNFPEAVKFWERLLKTHPDYAQADAVRKQIEAAQKHLKGTQTAKAK